MVLSESEIATCRRVLRPNGYVLTPENGRNRFLRRFCVSGEVIVYREKFIYNEKFSAQNTVDGAVARFELNLVTS